jgi:hypothetical protein
MVHAAAALVAACRLAALRRGRLSPEEGAALALAAELFDERMGRMGGRQLGNAFHAMVKAGHEPANGLRGRVLAALLADGGAKLRGNRAQSTSNALWALAVLHRDRGELVEPADIAALVGVASGKLRDDDTDPQALSNIAWALAVLKHEDRAFMGELLAVAKAQLPAFKPQELSNTLWAAATLGLPLPPSFLSAFLAAAGAQLPAFKPQALGIGACQAHPAFGQRGQPGGTDGPAPVRPACVAEGAAAALPGRPRRRGRPAPGAWLALGRWVESSRVGQHHLGLL